MIFRSARPVADWTLPGDDLSVKDEGVCDIAHPTKVSDRCNEETARMIFFTYKNMTLRKKNSNKILSRTLYVPARP